MLLPFYDEDILQIQYKIIEMIDENIVFANSCRKRKRFNIFVENIIEKNKDFLENIKKQEDEVNDINNYEEIIDDNIGLYDSNDSSNSSDSNDDCEQEYDETIFEKKDN